MPSEVEVLDVNMQPSATPVPPALTAIAARPQVHALTQSGNYALEVMSDEEFEQRLQGMVRVRQRVQRILRALMRENTHYMQFKRRKAEGDNGAAEHYALLKPGMEVLCDLFKLVPVCRYEVIAGDDDREPAIRVAMHCDVHAGDTSGPVVAQGFGTANSWETRYRWRTARRKCPLCGGETLRFQREAKGGPHRGQAVHWCATGAGGCGQEFLDTDPAIQKQTLGKVQNDQPWDLENTLVKIAEKRGKVDGVIMATATSDLFSQDVEDLQENGVKIDGLETATSTVDPDAWRAAAPTSAPAPTPAPAPGATPVAPMPDVRPCTPAQVTFMQDLARKTLGVKTDDDPDVALASRFDEYRGPETTLAMANHIISTLQAAHRAASARRK